MSTERVHACAPILPYAVMPSAVGEASGSAPLETVADLRKFLATVPDPRARRGIRHPWTAPLTSAAAAVLAGASISRPSDAATEIAAAIARVTSDIFTLES